MRRKLQVEIAFFHRWEFIENLLKFKPIRGLNYKINSNFSLGSKLLAFY